jgi:hypothetical protein
MSGPRHVTLRLVARGRFAGQLTACALSLRSLASAHDRAVRALGLAGTHGAAVLLDTDYADPSPFAAGWHAAEGDPPGAGWRWSGTEASLSLSPVFAAGNVAILLDCTQVYGGTPDDLEITVNGVACPRAVFKAPRGSLYRWTLALFVSGDQMAETHSLSLAIRCPTGGIPAEREADNADRRELGLAVQRLQVLDFSMTSPHAWARADQAGGA